MAKPSIFGSIVNAKTGVHRIPAGYIEAAMRGEAKAALQLLQSFANRLQYGPLHEDDQRLLVRMLGRMADGTPPQKSAMPGPEELPKLNRVGRPKLDDGEKRKRAIRCSILLEEIAGEETPTEAHLEKVGKRMDPEMSRATVRRLLIWLEKQPSLFKDQRPSLRKN